ncbi:MAG TPA: hypothetical protein VMB03_14470 [Bryobacteraceae bacterium]|nr:hypothetical protein [Bryobacteraceae bacterium]
MIDLFRLRVELIATLFAPFLAPGAVWLWERACDGRRRAVKRPGARLADRA